MSEPVKLVLSGGSPDKKAEAIRQVRKTAASKGYTVLLLPHAETLLRAGGVPPAVAPHIQEEQYNLLQLQLQLEQSFLHAARSLAADKLLLLCPRGTLDSRVCLQEQEFFQLLRDMDLSLLELRDRYDAVFLLESSHTPLAAAWTGHPHLRSLGSPQTNRQRLTSELNVLLDDPKPVEIERKFLIEYPNADWLEHLSPCQSVSIVQVYLKSRPTEELRIRRRSANGGALYYKTRKQSLTGMKRIETEHRISEAEYQALLADADPNRRPIQKTRYYFFHQDQYFELDVYPFWTDRAILEIELSDETAPVCLPQPCRLIKEVTDDPEYKNAALAKQTLPRS